jgi:Bacterial SH3 domain
MIRHAAVVIIALVLSPSWAWAQATDFTVNVQSAAVRQAPSTASPIVGQAPRGSVLEVTRDIGAWVKVAWPEAPDGIGYVHQSMGARARRTTFEERAATAFAPSASTATAAAAAPEAPIGPEPVPMSSRTVYVAPPTHFVGLGARMGGTPLGGFGVTSRIWSRNRLGLQVEASRSTLTSTTAVGRVTTMQFTPSLIYSLPDHVTDSVWLRPYLGAGAPVNRSTWKSGAPDATDSMTDVNMGMRAFGGSELTFPNVARFAVSADLGYLWSETPFPGFEQKGLGFSISAHWYVK